MGGTWHTAFMPPPPLFPLVMGIKICSLLTLAQQGCN